MRFQIIVTPSMAVKIFTDPPYGAMYIARALMEEGHDVRIESCDVNRIDYDELARRVRAYGPDVIGISSVVAMSYKYVKDVTLRLKADFPGVKIVVGGGLAAAAEALLKNSGTDIVVIGEGDVTVKELAASISAGRPYGNVKGIIYKEGEAVASTPPRPPIMKLDALGYPAFDLVDMNPYFIDMARYINNSRHDKAPDKRLFDPHRSSKMLRFMISRGCTSNCSFCYRPTPGLRHFSFDYIFNYIEYLMDRFGINIFSFGDECFSPSRAWNMKFLEELRARKLDIMFQVMGMRVDTVDYDILKGFKEAGCFIIMYGFESGSQKMLDIMDKRTSVERNIDVARWTKKAGIFTSPNLLLAMPGETTETVRQTVDFLKKTEYGPRWYQYAYALTVPGTPLYDYAMATGLIPDEDAYLDSLYAADVHDFVNTGIFINYTSEDLKT